MVEDLEPPAGLGLVQAEERGVILERQRHNCRGLETQQVVLSRVEVDSHELGGCGSQEIERAVPAAGHAEDSVTLTRLQRGDLGPPILVDGRVVDSAEETLRHGRQLSVG